MSRWWCTLGIVAMLATSARAQPAPQASPPSEQAIREAAERIDRGRLLFGRGDHAGALAEFEQAYALTQAWQVLVFIGAAQVKLFRYADGIATYERYLAEGGAAVPATSRAQVEEDLANVRAVIVRLDVVIAGAPAQVWIDDREVGTSPFAAPIVIGPGRHRVRAERDGSEPRVETIEVVSGEARRIELTLVERRAARASLTVDARPKSAELFLDGRPLGHGPWRGELAPGGYVVSARLARHREATEQVALGDGQTRAVMLTLAPLPEARKPFHRRWELWAVVGVAVAASATYGVLYATRPQPEVPIDWPE